MSYPNPIPNNASVIRVVRPSPSKLNKISEGLKFCPLPHILPLLIAILRVRVGYLFDINP